MKNATAGDIQIFRQKAASSEVIQFTGKNGKEVVEFVKERTAYAIRNGGVWVKFFDPKDRSTTVMITKGEFVCWSGSEIVIHDEEALRATHVINKTHALL